MTRVQENRLAHDLSDPWALPEGPSGVTAARHATREQLRALGVTDEAVVGTVELIVSELTGNVVKHAAGPSTLRVRRIGEIIRVEVCDPEPMKVPEEQNPDAEGIGAAKAMTAALADAKLNPEQIGYINAHGTSTQLGDAAETKAVKTVFGSFAEEVSISSTKSQLGHLLGASGGVEMVLIVQSLVHGVVPPTINYESPDPDCDLDYTPNRPRERKLTAAMSNSFGFGGHNASIIAGKFANGRH